MFGLEKLFGKNAKLLKEVEKEKPNETIEYYKKYTNYLLTCPEGDDLDRLWRH
jgi:hypothetical protein